MPRQSLLLWHGSDRPLVRFTAEDGPDGALHLGSRAQAEMRNRAYLHEVEIEVSRVRTSRDRGGDWGQRIRAARADGFDAIRYLNRYEGVRAETISRLAKEGRLRDLDRLPDAAFRRLIPEAEISWILLDPARARLLRIVKNGPSKGDFEIKRQEITPFTPENASILTQTRPD